MTRRRKRAAAGHKPKSNKPTPAKADAAQYDWDTDCEVCGQRPVLVATNLCAGCTFGSADAYVESLGGL